MDYVSIIAGAKNNSTLLPIKIVYYIEVNMFSFILMMQIFFQHKVLIF